PPPPPPTNGGARRCRPGRRDRLSGPWDVLDAGVAPDAAGVRAVASEAGDERADTGRVGSWAGTGEASAAPVGGGTGADQAVWVTASGWAGTGEASIGEASIGEAGIAAGGCPARALPSGGRERGSGSVRRTARVPPRILGSPRASSAVAPLPPLAARAGSSAPEPWDVPGPSSALSPVPRPRPLHAAVSSRRAPVAPGRAAGSRFISARITGSSGPARVAGGGSPCTMLARMAIALPWPSNGPRPSTAAYSVAPSDHRSEAGLAGSPPVPFGGPKPPVP